MTMPTVWVERGAMKDRWGEYRTITYEIPDSTAEAEESALAIYTPLTAFTAWAHTTHYTAGAVASDPDSGPWACLIEHTSAGTGTFAADRAANPTYWTQTTVEIFRPLLQRVRVQRQVRPGLAWLTCFYEPPTMKQVQYRNLGRGLLTLDVSTDEVRPMWDLGTPALQVWWQGLDAGENKFLRYIPTSGKGTTLLGRVMLELHVVTTQSTAEAIAALASDSSGHSTINSGAMANVFGAAAKTLRMLGVRSQRASMTAAYYEVQARMEYNGAGWNNDTYVQEQEWRIQQVREYDEEGVALTHRFHPHGDWRNTAADPWRAKLYNAVSWSAVDRSVGW